MNDRKYNKVFGIGLSKTGTSSLGIALNRLGVPTIDYPHDPATRAQLEAGDFRLKLLERYDAITDTPVVPYYPQLDELYPGSKFILTVRDIDSWLKSVEAHWADCGPWQQMSKNDRDFAYFIRAAVYGSVRFNESRYRYVYERHLDQVRHYFADRPDDLLEIDICGGQTMGPLGRFLGIDVADDPFPRANTKQDRRRNDEWLASLFRIEKQLDESLPADAVIAWADECRLLGLRVRSIRGEMTFPERDGIYLGPPANDQTACEMLERMRERGADFLVFVPDTMWWLDHYAGLAQHLRAVYDCRIDSPGVVVFDLRSARVPLAARNQ